MDSSLLLATLARQRLINALALGIPPQALSGGLAPLLVGAPGLIPFPPAAVDTQALSPLAEVAAVAASEWTAKEDALLKSLIAEHGTSKWSRVAAKMVTKSNRQCRRRWQAIMNSMGNKGSWTAEEDAKLMEGHRRFGNRWTDIARLVPGRTDNAVKNRFAALVAKGEGVKAAKVMRWSEVCVAPSAEKGAAAGETEAETSAVSSASPKRKAAPSASAADSVDCAAVPSLKRLRSTASVSVSLTLDLNLEPEEDVTGRCVSGASESECSCLDHADSPATAGFCVLDLNFPASA